MLMPADPDPRQEAITTDVLFQPGELIRHRRYHYRGVIVAVDHACHADDAWYQKNQTQPDRDQPWYHVLVHNSSSTTYAAQENLQPDPDGEPVDHPFIEYFFSGFVDGKHIRNDTPWPES